MKFYKKVAVLVDRVQFIYLASEKTKPILIRKFSKKKYQWKLYKCLVIFDKGTVTSTMLPWTSRRELVWPIAWWGDISNIVLVVLNLI